MKYFACVYILFGALLFGAEPLRAQVSSDVVVMLQASVTQTPPRITLRWQTDASATSVVLVRRLVGAASWGANKTLLKTDTVYVDTTVVVGTEYEYRITRVVKHPTAINAIGYIRSGIDVTVGDNAGGCILVVDTTYAAFFKNELIRLEQDLLAEGNVVTRVNVNANDSVPAIKYRLSAIYNADPDNIKTLFVFGHVPIPYSGFINPDGHPDHLGAWPTDNYYGEFDGDWTDAYIDTSKARRPINHNVNGDGKFDQSQLPDDVNLQIGRVDLSNMPNFVLSEKELLKQYLDKDHAYRTGEMVIPERALIDDNFGYFGGEAFASSGWRNFAPLVGSDSIHELDWFTTLPSTPYLWAYGCGGGYDNSCSGVGTTADFAANDSRAVFTLLFGSYFGDWNLQNNFLRAPLCTSYGLTCAWSGRPYWDVFPMGMGHSTGEVAMLTTNNSGTYVANYANYWVHVELMGDPTLRLRPFAAPKSVSASIPAEKNSVMIDWQGTSGVDNYNVYRASVKENHFVLLNSTPIVGTNYVDWHPIADSAIYLVRGVRSEITKSGNYLNLSHGAFVTVQSGLKDAVHQSGSASSNKLSVIYPVTGTIATVMLDLQDAGRITLEIVDLQGRTVEALANDYYSNGAHQFDWNFAQYANGLYFVRMTGAIEPLSSKILVRKF